MEGIPLTIQHLKEGIMTQEKQNVGVFIASKGNRRGVANRFLFVCDIEEAKRFCSDNRTSGLNFMTVWTEILPDKLTAKSFIKDNGRFDELYEELDIEVKYWADIDMARDFPNA